MKFPTHSLPFPYTINKFSDPYLPEFPTKSLNFQTWICIDTKWRTYTHHTLVSFIQEVTCLINGSTYKKYKRQVEGRRFVRKILFLLTGTAGYTPNAYVFMLLIGQEEHAAILLANDSTPYKYLCHPLCFQ